MQTITIYPITERQLGPLRIPHRLCEECAPTIRLVRRVVDGLGRDDVHVQVKPWLRHMFDALRRGGWHAPVATIDGEVSSQGVVPDADALTQRLRTGAEQRG